MKFGNHHDVELDETDLRILEMLQDDCRTALARIGEGVGLSAPAVQERIRKLEAAGVITGFRALIDARRLGLDITAFIGVGINHPTYIEAFESQITSLPDVLECHHVTGQHTVLLKVKTANTSSLEALIREIRTLPGVERTETMVVLSTHTERVQLALHPADAPAPAARRHRRNGEKTTQLRGA